MNRCFRLGWWVVAYAGCVVVPRVSTRRSVQAGQEEQSPSTAGVDAGMCECNERQVRLQSRMFIRRRQEEAQLWAGTGEGSKICRQVESTTV